MKNFRLSTLLLVVAFSLLLTMLIFERIQHSREVETLRTRCDYQATLMDDSTKWLEQYHREVLCRHELAKSVLIRHHLEALKSSEELSGMP